MRNIVQYPITKDELLLYVEAQYDKLMARDNDPSTVACGDMTGLYLLVIRSLIKESELPKENGI